MLRGLFAALMVLGFAASAQAQRTGSHGSIVVEGVEPGADVYVDGELAGQTPVAPVSVEAGAHTVRVARPGFTEFTDVVRVRKGKATTVTVEILPVSMILTVRTDPPAAQVFVDEKFAGEAPLDLDLVDGKHQVRAKKSGFRDFRRSVDARAGNTDEWELKLEAIPQSELLAQQPLPADAWYQQPTTWLLVGGAAAVVATGVVLLVVLTGGEDSATDKFCAKGADCVRVP